MAAESLERCFVALLNWSTPRLRRLSARATAGRPAGESSAGWAIGLRERPGGESEEVALSPRELDRHLYVLGSSGSGKSRFLELLVRQHLRTGQGFCLIDPHGDLTQDVLAYLYEEHRRSEKAGSPLDLGRAVLVEPFSEDALVGCNPLDPGGGALHPHVGEIVGIFRRFWASSWGPRMEEVLRNTLLALASAGYTLTEVAPFLTDGAFRRAVLRKVPDEAVRAYWTHRFDPLSDSARAAMAEPVLNKMGALLADPRVRGMLGQASGGLDLRALMDGGAWVFVNCSRGHLRDAAYLLGSLFVARLQTAALSRADLPERERRPFTVLVDEFQHFRGEDFETILCEARKYRLRLVLAHQHLEQLDPSLQRAIFGNVATHLFFAVSPQDAAIVSKQFAGGSPLAQSLVHLPVGTALLHRRGSTAVRTRILPVLTPPVPDPALGRFRARLRARWGKPLGEVESEIRGRLHPVPTGPEGGDGDPGGGPKREAPGGSRGGKPSAAAEGPKKSTGAPPPVKPKRPGGAAPVREAEDD